MKLIMNCCCDFCSDVGIYDRYLCCDFCSDVGIYDRVVIQELLKTVAQSHQLDSSSQRDFKGSHFNYLLLDCVAMNRCCLCAADRQVLSFSLI